MRTLFAILFAALFTVSSFGADEPSQVAQGAAVTSDSGAVAASPTADTANASDEDKKETDGDKETPAGSDTNTATDEDKKS